MNADAPIATEMRTALRALLRDAAKECRKAAKKARPKSVHHARTALRRVEAAVDVVGALQLAKPKRARRLREDLHSLEKKLGDARDDDVLLDTVKDVPLLVDCVTRHRKKAAKKLRKALDAKAASRVLARTKRLAKRRLDGDSALVRHRSGEALAYALAAIAAFDRHVPLDLDDVVIHHVRARARSLRYVVELFGEALGPDAPRIAAELRALQTRLGTMHDHVFAVERIKDMLDDELPHTPEVDDFLHEEERARDRLRKGFMKEWSALRGGFEARVRELPLSPRTRANGSAS